MISYNTFNIANQKMNIGKQTVSAIFVFRKQQYLMFLLFADNDNFNGSRTRDNRKKKKNKRG